MIQSTFELPQGYALARRVDLQKDRKLFWLVNGLSLTIVVMMIPVGTLMGPAFAAWYRAFPWYGWIGLAAGMIAYIVLHEAVHGVAIRLYSGRWGHFGFTGAYAYAGSKAYFAKKPYAVIALSPVVVWGVVCMLGCALCPALFWPFYIVQIINLSGAAGDYYVSYLLCRLPEDVLIQDDGVSMTFYTRHDGPKDE